MIFGLSNSAWKVLTTFAAAETSFCPVTTASLAGQCAVQIRHTRFLGGDAEDRVLDDVHFGTGLDQALAQFGEVPDLQSGNPPR